MDDDVRINVHAGVCSLDGNHSHTLTDEVWSIPEATSDFFESEDELVVDEYACTEDPSSHTLTNTIRDDAACRT